MSLTIIDTYPEILSLIKQMDGTFHKTVWEQYLGDISTELFCKVTKDSSGYDYDSEVLPVMNLLIGHSEKIEEAHDSFLSATNGLEEIIKAKTGAVLNAQLVFYIGLCNGAGWATTLNGNPAVLLGVEKIVELNWYNKKTMTALIYHELGNLWHDSIGVLRRETTSMRDKYVWQMLQEGMAMYFEQLLADDFGHYHQDKNGWLDWCFSNKDELDVEFLRRLQSNGSAQEFFGDWQKYNGHSDVGYFIGCEFVKWLLQKYTINEVANFELDTAYQELCKYVEER